MIATVIAAMAVLAASAPSPALSQTPASPPPQQGTPMNAASPNVQNPQEEPTEFAPDLPALVLAPRSEMQPVIEQFTADQELLLRRFPVRYSPARQRVLTGFYRDWLKKLHTLPFTSFSEPARVDYVLLKNKIEWDQDRMGRDSKIYSEMAPLLPFAADIQKLEEDRARMLPVDPAAAAKTVKAIATAASDASKSVDGKHPPAKLAAYRAAAEIESLQNTLRGWFSYYDGYDPLFSWWVRAPYRSADEALANYRRDLRERVLDIKEGEDEPIVGTPIGREALVSDLQHEMVDYTPEELITIAGNQLQWCESQMKQASREMGYGDDWKKALEKVKQDYVPPGQQRDLVRDLEFEAVAFVRDHDLVTVPPLAQETWRIEMMSPERQKVNPFFTGGEVLSVSYPTDTMSEDDKLQSLRGNNVHFARATVMHEMIPGHRLQMFLLERNDRYRGEFRTPFWLEGSAFYWETAFWDRHFFQTPEDRIGHLFWRMHRAARVIFSLNFHLGKWSPEQCIDFLVDRVGHERANAEAEVRRSFNGDYPPLYQAAYEIGCLQLRALHHEVVDSGKTSEREFNDFIYMHGPIPVEMLRAGMLRETLDPAYTTRWRFADTLPD